MIREAAAADADSILELYPLLFEAPGVPAPSWEPASARRRLLGTLESERSTVLLSELGELLIGICTAYLDVESVRYGQRCWVEDLVVAPDHRSRGAGEALLGAAREWTSERGATHLELDSGLARSDAHRFYERLEPDAVGRQYSWILG